MGREGAGGEGEGVGMLAVDLAGEGVNIELWLKTESETVYKKRIDPP